MKLLSHWCWIASGLFAATLNAQNPNDFDRDHNGKLDAVERQVLFIHRNSAAFRELDTDFDGKISPAEIKKLEYKETQTASLDEISWQRSYAGTDPAPTSSELSTLFPIKSKTPETDVQLWGIQIRRSLADVTLEGDYNPLKTPPATFSYQRDLAHDTDAWTAKGVVARPFLLPGVGSSSIIPSFEFDRFSHAGDPSKERDLLIARIGSEIGLPGIPDGTKKAGNRLRINAAYKTDSGFREKTWAGEVEWETSLGPLGGYHPVGNLPLAWFPRAYPRAEFGTRTDNRDSLTADQKDFFRVGPVLALKLVPNFRNDWDKRLVASFDYAYLLSAKGDGSVRNFTARLDWVLDANGHFKLGIEYQNGALTLEQHRTRLVTASLGIGF
jgi:hypothetical protein